MLVISFVVLLYLGNLNLCRDRFESKAEDLPSDEASELLL